MKLNQVGVKLVLEKDGTCINEDEVLVVLKDETFILLQEDEAWKKAGDEDLSSDTTSFTFTSSTVTLGSSINEMDMYTAETMNPPL